MMISEMHATTTTPKAHPQLIANGRKPGENGSTTLAKNPENKLFKDKLFQDICKELKVISDDNIRLRAEISELRTKLGAAEDKIRDMKSRYVVR